MTTSRTARRSTQEIAASLGELVNDVEAGRLMGGLSPQTLRNWRTAGKGPVYLKVGVLVRYRRQDLAEFIAGGGQVAIARGSAA